MSRVSIKSGDGIRGFTLLEVLLAMLLLAILMSAVYAAINTSRHLVQGGLEQAQRNDQVLAAHQFLRQALSQVRPVAVADEPNEVASMLAGGPTQLRFVAPAAAAWIGDGLQVQQLQLVRMGDRNWRLQLKMADLPAKGASPDWRLPPEVLLDGIVAGQFAYRGEDPADAPGQWNSQWKRPTQLPRLISLQLQLAGSQAWPRLVVPVRIDSDPGASGDDSAGELP